MLLLYGKSYGANSAHEMAMLRKSANSSIPIKLKSQVVELMEKYIKRNWSPEQTSATLRIKHNIEISFVRIYQYIEANKEQGGTLYTHLQFYNRKRRAKYGSRCSNGIKNRVSISQRPEIVEKKERIGDFEIDTIIGKGKKGAITTIVDRASSYLKISLPTTKRAEDVEGETKRLLAPFKDLTHTITSDNGLEFANHKNISKALDCDYFFCHPYSSWERRLNEYTNGLIRQYIPKGSSFTNLTQKEILEIENKLNHRPRKDWDGRLHMKCFLRMKWRPKRY